MRDNPVTVTPERIEALQGQWCRLLGSLGVPVADCYAPFDRLVERYTEPHRHYHTLEHIGEMLRVAGRLAKEVKDPASLQLAIWYHDAIYDPTRSDNEAQSAALAHEELKIFAIPTELIEERILATDHKSDPRECLENAIILDADLAILGASVARYDRYAVDIRKEYGYVPEAEYRAGRAAVLKSF
jgi:predicted metal-dependent HD superfamily phosphohydrolase